MTRRGATLTELLVGMVITGIAAAGIFTIFLSLHSAQTFSVEMPTSQQQATEMAKELAGAFRRAELCTSADSGCTLNAAMQSTTASSVTVYSRNAGGTLVPITYDVVGGAFRRTTGGTTTVIYPSGSSLSITYYQGNGYHDDTLATFTPTSATTPTVIGVKIDASANIEGRSATYSTVVRLRNGPKKITPVEE